MRKVFGVFLATVLLSLNFYGCGSQSSSTGKTKPATITVWHWMTDRESVFQELAKRYEAKTGIKINFELYAPSDVYSQKVRAAAQGSTLPDIFGLLGEKRDFASFIKAGHILNLDSYMNESMGLWKNKFFSKALAVNEFPADNIYKVPAGIYGVPIDIMAIEMVYNKSLFKALGLNPNRPPENFQEFLEIGRKISATGGTLPGRQAGASGGKAKNIQGLVSGWGETWLIDCFASNYAFNIMGKDKVLATIKGDVPYTDPDWIKVLVLFKEMKEAGILADSVVTMVNKTAEQLFANDKAVFAFNGSWCVNVYKGMNPDLNYAAMLPPRASQNYPMAIWGGAGSSFMINAKSPDKEEAVKFLQWLTDKEQQVYLAETTSNIPSNKESLSKTFPVLAQFAKDAQQNSTHPNIWGVAEFPVVIETMDKGIQSIIIGEKTPEKVAQEVQKVKERQLAKKR